MTRPGAVEVRAEHLATGDVVVSARGALWTVETVLSYEDRDGKHQVAATGHTRSGQSFSLLKPRHYGVQVQAS